MVFVFPISITSSGTHVAANGITSSLMAEHFTVYVYILSVTTCPLSTVSSAAVNTGCRFCFL